MVRENNEDSFAVFENGLNGLKSLAVVADGMGGHQSGEVASDYAISSFVSRLKDMDTKSGEIMDFLTEAVHYANEQLYKMSLSASKYYGMGTTFTACVVENGKGYVAHVGDSRLYLLKNGVLNQITYDHTYVNEMIKAGLMTEEEALTHPRRSALTKALGVDKTVEVDGYVFDFDDKDTVLLCSDGLTGMVDEDEIALLIRNRENFDIVNSAESLVQSANKYGGIDNVTVILLRA
jgi:protein phosphatase